jgi:hypothetical protein
MGLTLRENYLPVSTNFTNKKYPNLGPRQITGAIRAAGPVRKDTIN